MTDFVQPVTDYVAPSYADGSDLLHTGIGVNKNKDLVKCDELMDRLRSEVVMKRIRIKEFFRDIDKLRKGYCSADQFRRTLQLTDLQITDHQMFLLYDKYRLPDGLVNYKQFCEDIDLIWTKPGIEQNPLEKVNKVTEDSTLMARRDYFDVNNNEEAKLDDFLNGIRKEIFDRRLLLKPHFQDFDRVRNGYCTKSQFLRILNQFGILATDEYINLLLKRYVDKGSLHEVNYYRFCNDVDGQDDVTKTINDTYANKFQVPQNTMFSQPYIYNNKPNGLEEVITKIQKKVKEERIRIGEFLRDFDRLRCGSIANSQFRIGMNMAKLPLSQREFDILIEAFACPGKANFMNWRQFSDCVDEIFNIKGLEKAPLGDTIKPLTTYLSAQQQMTPDEKALAENVIERFKYFCLATRLYVKGFFQDWDALGRNKVTPKQFRQVLVTVRFALSDEECKAVTKYFLTDDGYVNYSDFIDLTQPAMLTGKTIDLGIDHGRLLDHYVKREYVDKVQPASYGADGSPVYAFMEDLKVDPNFVIDRIKKAVKTSRIRLKEYLQDFDPLRKGTITVNKFFGSLDKLKLHLTENEAKALERIFVCPDDRTCLNYNQFVDEIDLVFTTPG